MLEQRRSAGSWGRYLAGARSGQGGVAMALGVTMAALACSGQTRSDGTHSSGGSGLIAPEGGAHSGLGDSAGSSSGAGSSSRAGSNGAGAASGGVSAAAAGGRDGDAGASARAGAGGSAAPSSGGNSSGSGGTPSATAGTSSEAGSTSDAGAGNFRDEPIPSAGCKLGNLAPPERAMSSALSIEVARKFPSRYDGASPLPLVLALHATNFTAGNMIQSLTMGQPGALGYVLVAPQESRDAALSNFENRNSADFSRLLAELTNELCVDERRLFGVGNGSGGRALFRWIGHVASKQPDVPRLRGAAMVGSYIGAQPNAYALPTIFIHPLMSNNSRAVAGDEDGMKAMQFFKTRNGCGDVSTPVSAASCVAGGMPVNPGCVDYLDCAEPLRFCHHDDLTGQSSGDPWSCMASAAIFQFFEPLLASAAAP